MITYTCAICGKSFSPYSFAVHLKKEHNMTSKEYYDLYMKKPGEGICPICGKPTPFRRLCNGYQPHCSKSCGTANPKTKEKHEQTCLLLHNDKKFSNRAQAIKTFHENHPNIKQKKETIPWSEKTDQEKQKIVKKRKQTIKDKHGDENWVNMEAQYETNLRIYGTKYSCCSKNNLEKSEKTILNKFGSKENYYQNNLKKAEETNLKKYGFKHPAQSPDIDCSSHRIQYDGYNFDSNWEYLYYKYLKENNIEFTYKPNISFEFVYEDKIHYYKPDFVVNGIITEVKGDHFFKEGKMICPWKHKNDTPEQIEWRNGLFEAKHQCMIKNGVTILKYQELHDIGIL